MCKGKQTSLNQMQQQVKRGQAPKSIKRIDIPKYGKPHIHFKDGTSLNFDGSVHDAFNGVHTLSNEEAIWLFENGWG